MVFGAFGPPPKELPPPILGDGVVHSFDDMSVDSADEEASMVNESIGSRLEEAIHYTERNNGSLLSLDKYEAEGVGKRNSTGLCSLSTFGTADDASSVLTSATAQETMFVKVPPGVAPAIHMQRSWEIVHKDQKEAARNRRKARAAAEAAKEKRAQSKSQPSSSEESLVQVPSKPKVEIDSSILEADSFVGMKLAIEKKKMTSQPDTPSTVATLDDDPVFEVEEDPVHEPAPLPPTVRSVVTPIQNTEILYVPREKKATRKTGLFASFKSKRKNASTKKNLEQGFEEEGQVNGDQALNSTSQTDNLPAASMNGQEQDEAGNFPGMEPSLEVVYTNGGSCVFHSPFHREQL